MTNSQTTHPLMIALDFQTNEEVQNFLNQFPHPEQLTVKIGMELFYRYGPMIVTEIQKLGCAIFLDLKLFDIPNTVERALTQLGELGVNYVTVHTLGGSTMLQAAKRGLTAGAKRGNVTVPHLLGVTELTSISPAGLREEQNCRLDMTEQVVSLAHLAQQSGCDGVITSALELPALVQQVGANFEYVVPGIRLASDAAGDQQRVATPQTARQDGATAIVVGRPINQSSDPVVAYDRYDAAWTD
ncbi:orotidine-5'-phosphate decarboxylase [Fructilactobacillus cliffordii]|uniref:orotidine-5'-phosphate decarboxylase n=1 Tax=Fructilactobacillus cliffordii TaxID=2940299 RepID=UPI002092C5E1|nr:orotidine-5'-phosphate decarboxylase [Fructilactobacillus cliffordii]USS87166.1 orotidine-5'-phosphate decarboxylase [Fructilactobacillus cliffordii]